MPKATITYDLDDNDDLMAYNRANKSLDMSLAIWDITYNTRKEIERDLEHNNAPESSYDLLHEILGKIHAIFDDHGIRIDDLVV